jgi:GntR family transcriptional regulator
MTDTAALPKYLQVSERLARQVTAGLLRAGERLPPEREMAEGLGIAVGTLRKALDQLAAQGMLERVQGSGNYIRKPVQASNIYAFFRLELVAGGGLPTARVLTVERVAKPGDLPAFGTSAEGHRLRRLRALDGVPVALEEIWLDGDVAARVTPADLSESLYLFYRERLGLAITRIEDRVGIAPPPGFGAEVLALPDPACFVERLSWAVEDHPIEFSRTWVHSDRARYVARS